MCSLLLSSILWAPDVHAVCHKLVLFILVFIFAAAFTSREGCDMQTCTSSQFPFACPVPGRSFPDFTAWGFPTHQLLRCAVAPVVLSCSPSPLLGHRSVGAAPLGLSSHRAEAAPSRAKVEVGHWAGSCWVGVMAAFHPQERQISLSCYPYMLIKAQEPTPEMHPHAKHRERAPLGVGMWAPHEVMLQRSSPTEGVSGSSPLCGAGMGPPHAPPREHGCCTARTVHRQHVLVPVAIRK